MTTPRDIATRYLAVLNAVRKFTDEKFIAGALVVGDEGLQRDRERALELYRQAEEMLDAAAERYDSARLLQLREFVDEKTAELEREEARARGRAGRRWGSGREEFAERAEKLALRRALLDAERDAIESARKRARRAKVST